MKGRVGVLCLVVLACFLVGSCRGKKTEGETGPVLAKVNDRVITSDDFAISADLLYPPAERPQFTSKEGKEALLQQMIIMELFYQEGVAQGIDQNPRFKQIMENYKRYLVYNTLMNRGINTASVMDFYRTNFVHVAIIALKKPDKATAEQAAPIRARAEQIRQEIASGGDFTQAARKYSEHPSAANGGDVGAITRTEQWEPGMMDAALALTEKEPLSQVVETPNGFYIIKLIEQGSALPIDKITAEVRMAIYAQMLKQNYATYAAQLQSQANVQINQEVLDTLKLDNLMGVGGAPLQNLTPEGVPGVDPRATP